MSANPEMGYSVFSTLIPRVSHQIRLHGVKGTAVKVARRARKALYLDETHVWYELPLGGDPPRPALKTGMELVRGGEEHLPLLDEFPSINGPGAKLWLDSGAALWLLFDGDRPVFICWTFQSPAKFEAAQGWISLPPGVAIMEESAVSPSYRGRGVLAPIAWSRVADNLQHSGTTALITKVEEHNKVMRWSLSRSGFHESFTVRLWRLAPVSRTTIITTNDSNAEWLASQTKARVLTTLS